MQQVNKGVLRDIEVTLLEVTTYFTGQDAIACKVSIKLGIMGRTHVIADIPFSMTQNIKLLLETVGTQITNEICESSSRNES